MRQIFAVAVGLMALGAARGQEQSEETKVIGRLVGTWKTEFVNKRAELNPTETKFTGRVTCKLVLGGKFIEEVGSSLGKDVEHRVLWHYDPQKKAYRYWFFDSNGTAGDGVGTWDEKTKTMTWKTEPGDGLIGTAAHHFLNDDTYEWTYVIKDNQGKVFLDYYGKHTRAK